MRHSFDRRLRHRRSAVPHPDIHDRDAAAVVTPAIEVPRDEAAIDFVEMTPLIERMRLAFFINGR